MANVTVLSSESKKLLYRDTFLNSRINHSLPKIFLQKYRKEFQGGDFLGNLCLNVGIHLFTAAWEVSRGSISLSKR